MFVVAARNRLQADSYTGYDISQMLRRSSPPMKPCDPGKPPALRRSGEARNASQPDYLRKISADQRFTPSAV
jgi:hypothetical protein